MKPVFRANLYFLGILVLAIFAPTIINPTVNGITINPLLALIIRDIIIFILPIIIYIWITKGNTKRVLMLGKQNNKNFLRAILIGILAQPVIKFCHYVSNLFYANQEVVFLQSTRHYPIWLLIVMAGLIPAIVEELTVRGVVLSGYSYKSKGIAAFMTGVMYAMLNLNPSKFMYALFIGIILAYMVRATGSIIVSITSHFTINLIQLVVQRIKTHNLTNEEMAMSLNVSSQMSLSTRLSYLVIYFVLAILFTAIIMRIIRAMEKENLNIYLDDLDTETKIEYKHEEVVNIPFILSVLVFIVYIIYNFYINMNMNVFL